LEKRVKNFLVNLLKASSLFIRVDAFLFVFLQLMYTKKAFLLLNGEAPKKIPDLTKYDLICATDGAYQYLKEKKIQPNFISGDFDSLDHLPTDVEIIHTPNQYFTKAMLLGVCQVKLVLSINFKSDFTKN
jgi:hypothetical protein